MNRPLYAAIFHLALLLGLATAGSGCDDNLVGRLCDLGKAPLPNEVVVATSSLDCVTRTCLRVPLTRELPAGSEYPGGNQGLCTAECSGDDDCDRVPESPCKTGFTCGIAVTAGESCCKKFCICKDYFLIPPSQAACDANNVANECCNLKGRRGSDQYPACK
jgi:hypothetical protein